jgi:hypothetical protein
LLEFEPYIIAIPLQTVKSALLKKAFWRGKRLG